MKEARIDASDVKKDFVFREKRAENTISVLIECACCRLR